ncbi:Microsomal glutathione S-transferase [Lachnellula hyalina]|uniref:Microsomal glutathione S-transferase n=1 Tax=Lachnellula hyalina TaxID=1316788 RepID=A0A8H8RA60_9HELO|nr:Microsomal glutathione S-transferase [Lachnellula hyalina]TVY30799.1 Microsomal glutathione S-transferase [Lachnellula hyalina]
MATMAIAPDYGYVLLAATSTFIVNILHMLNTGAYRKAAKISYPAAYAPSSRTDADAHRFNCAQRAHANYIENQVSTLGALFIAGLSYPRVAAGMGLGWSACGLDWHGGVDWGGDYFGVVDMEMGMVSS